MTYSFVKPDAGPSPALDATQIQTNFSKFGTVFAVNHSAMNNPNQGDHSNIILTNQSQDPTVSKNLAVVYCKTSTGSTGNQPQLFVKIPSFLPTANDPTIGPFAAMHISFNVVNTAGPIYQSFLPGGNIVLFGSTTNIAVPITLPSYLTGLLVAIATPNQITTAGTGIAYNVSTSILSSNSFQIFSTLNAPSAAPPYSFGWIAIGIA